MIFNFHKSPEGDTIFKKLTYKLENNEFDDMF